MDTIRNKLIALIAAQLAVPEDQINPHGSLRDIGVDSLEMIDFVTKIEDEFSIRIPDDALEKIDSIADLAVEVEKALAGNPVMLSN
jgi:acyl carrier protein